MRVLNKHSHFGLFYVIVAVSMLVLLTQLNVQMRLELAEPGPNFFGENDGRLNVIATMDGLLRVAFIFIPALMGLAHFMLKNIHIKMSRAAVLLFVLAIVCLAIGVLWPFEPVANDFGEGWVMYPPLSVEGTPGPIFDWIIASIVLVGLSVVLSILGFIFSALNKNSK